MSFETTTCPAHPEQSARDACNRCGSYGCDHCLVSGIRSEPLCKPCDARLAAETSQRVQRPAFILRAALVTYAVTSVPLIIATMAGLHEEHPLNLTAGLMFFVAMLTSFITWCVWFRRANQALRARAMVLEYGPNAWGWFAVPVAFWFKPYQSVLELYTRSTNTLLVGSRLLVVWWALWVTGNLVAPRAWASSTSDFDTYRELGSMLLLAAAAVLAQRIVRDVTRSLALPHASEAEHAASWAASPA